MRSQLTARLKETVIQTAEAHVHIPSALPAELPAMTDTARSADTLTLISAGLERTIKEVIVMATCPNCGEIVMTGDPYCTNCGATLRWHFDDEEEYEPPEEKNPWVQVFHMLKDSDLTTEQRFDIFKKRMFLTDSLESEILEEIHDEEKLYKCRFVMVHTQDYPQTYIFLRQDKFRDVLILNKCCIMYTPGRFDPEERQIRYDYTKLFNNPKFQSEVARIESEGLRFKEVYSNITVPIWENDITVSFSDGSKIVSYEIDDDLNFKKL